MAELDARTQILAMLESGKITAAQAVELIQALGEDDSAETTAQASMVEPLPPAAVSAAAEPPAQFSNPEPVEPAAPLPAPEPVFAPEGAAQQQSATPVNEAAAPEMNGFRNWWRYPLWAGVAVTVLGAFFMYLAFRSSGYGFWFACAWFPFLFGVAMLALAWGSRQARWLHVRIHRQPGESPQRIFISMPLPLRLAAWIIQVFNIRTPELDKKGLSDLILALERTSPEAPLYVHVNDSDDGERVEVYIG